MSAKSSSTSSNAARCQHRTAAGRQCRSLADDPSSGLCPHHAVQVSVNLDFRDELTQDAYNFQRPQGVNNSLAVLYNLLAEGRISPRRASVLAYISSLLLRTIPAINDDNENYTYGDEEADEETSEEAHASPVPQSVPPGREPLPATAREFADAVLSRKPS